MTTEHDDEIFVDAPPPAGWAGQLFRDCTFQHVMAAEASLGSTRFLDCTFVECDLALSRVMGTSVKRAVFRACKLSGLDWTKAGETEHLTFESCNLSYSAFTGRDLRHSVFRDCQAWEVDFSHANLEAADFRRTDLRGADFSQSNLRAADFRGAVAYSISPTSAKLRKTRFSLPEAVALLDGLDILLDR